MRYVYNWGLRQRTDAYYQRQEHLYYEQLAMLLTALKRQEATLWLQEASSVPLQQALRHLERAFRNFFDGQAKYPTLKKKRGPQSATYASTAFSWNGTNLTLAKMERPLDIHWSRPLPRAASPSSVTVLDPLNQGEQACTQDVKAQAMAPFRRKLGAHRENGADTQPCERPRNQQQTFV